MIDLTPRQAASLSNEVYALTKFPILEDAITYLNHEYGGNLSFYEENLLKGKTGGPGLIKVRTAFGFLLVGRKNLKGQAYILFRGTQYLADWLTNLNLTLSPSAVVFRILCHFFTIDQKEMTHDQTHFRYGCRHQGAA